MRTNFNHSIGSWQTLPARKLFPKQTLSKVKHERQELFDVLRTNEVHFEAKNEKGLDSQKNENVC